MYDTRSLSRVMSLRGHRQLLVCAAARSSKGGRIASGDMDGTVMYWDLRFVTKHAHAHAHAHNTTRS